VPAFLAKAVTWLFTTKAGQWLLTAVLKPLLEKVFKKITKGINNWWESIKRKRKRKKRIKEDSKRVQSYEDASDPDSAHDEFNQLP
jgi:hypothetical protein